MIWTGVPQGSYTLTAKATDNQGAESTSAAVTVTVNAAVASTLYYIHTDHLNTPRLITNEAQQPVWRWDNTDPFGGNPPDENPSGLGTFTCNLRLPGQYFDRETNTHYNYFRDYDPAIGRYVQSDPIGLTGGLNTYIYVVDPVSEIDLEGLMGRGPGKIRANVSILPYAVWVATAPLGIFPIPGYSEFPGSCGSRVSYPNRYGGADFEPACQRHDQCYVCSAPDKREECDKDFRKNIVNACNGDAKCIRAAFAYYAAVMAIGKSAFQAAQNLPKTGCNICR